MPATIISTELKQYHNIVLQWDGPNLNESNDSTFMDYRLDVTFTQGTLSFTIPGHWAADGNAANTSANSGTKFHCIFSPPTIGVWNYTVSFKQGSNVAINGGGSGTSFDGDSGSINVIASDKSGRDFRSPQKGWTPTDTQNVNAIGTGVKEAYRRFLGSGLAHGRNGMDSPETFLNFEDFDNTPAGNGGLQDYNNHVADYNPGDPTWGSNLGRGIIGAVNYLASVNINSIYMIVFNLGGDGNDIFPWREQFGSKKQMDVSKLAQWEVVFSHMESKGVAMHILFQETENDGVLGGLSDERKLFFREFVSRFAHHKVVYWNLGEENNTPNQDRKDFADYIEGLDVYRHTISYHTRYDQGSTYYNGTLGHDSLTATSIQGTAEQQNALTIDLRQRSINAGRPLLQYFDEQGPPVNSSGTMSNNELKRLRVGHVGTFMGGGSGVEFYVADADLSLNDFRTVSEIFPQASAIHTFFTEIIPGGFSILTPDNSLIAGGSNLCAKNVSSQVFVGYLENGGSQSINLAGQSGDFEVDWWDPQNGGVLQKGSVSTVTGGSTVSLGLPPSGGNDWLVLVSTGNTNPGNCQAFWKEENFVVAIDATKVQTLPNNWTVLTGDGSTDGGFLRYQGNESTVGQDELVFSVEIVTAGEWGIQLRHRPGPSAQPFSEGSQFTGDANDCFMKVTSVGGDDYYVRKGGSTTGDIVYPNGSGQNPTINDEAPTSDNATNGYLKIFHNFYQTWSFLTQSGDGAIDWFVYAVFDTPGVYDIRISGRSFDWELDRIVLWNLANSSRNAATNIGLAETICQGSSVPETPTLNIDCGSATENSIPMTFSYSGADLGGTIQIERSIDNINFNVISSFNPNTASSYTDTGLASSTTYYYRARYVVSGGSESSYTATQTCTTDAGTGLCVIANVVADCGDPNGVVITWTVGGNTSGRTITVERSTDGSNFTEIATGISPGALTYTDFGSTAAGTYYYRLSCIAPSSLNNKVLHFTKTNGYNHNTKTVSLQMFQDFGLQDNYTVVNDDSGSEFDDLSTYDIIIFTNTSGDNLLTSGRRTNFENFIAGGGSVLGLHAATDTERHSTANGGGGGGWDYYAELIGGSVQQGPNHTTQNFNAQLTKIDPSHPSVQNIGSGNTFNRSEEYYYWENGYLKNDINEILRVGNTGSQSYDAARPHSWWRETGFGGRVFYTAMGHEVSYFTGDSTFQQHLRDAMQWLFDSLGSGGGVVEDTSDVVSCVKSNNSLPTPTSFSTNCGEATSSTIRLSWHQHAPSSNTSFTVQRSLDGVNFNTLTTVPVADSMEHFDVEFLDTSLIPNTTYHYRVRATDGVDVSAFTPIQSCTTLDVTPFPCDTFYSTDGGGTWTPTGTMTTTALTNAQTNGIMFRMDCPDCPSQIFGPIHFPPDLADEIVTTPLNTAVTIDFTSNNTDPLSLSIDYVILQPPTNGTASFQGGNPDILYTPHTGFSGADLIVVQGTNSAGEISTENIVINVGSPPIADLVWSDTSKDDPDNTEIDATGSTRFDSSALTALDTLEYTVDVDGATYTFEGAFGSSVSAAHINAVQTATGVLIDNTSTYETIKYAHPTSVVSTQRTVQWDLVVKQGGVTPSTNSATAESEFLKYTFETGQFSGITESTDGEPSSPAGYFEMEEGVGSGSFSQGPSTAYKAWAEGNGPSGGGEYNSNILWVFAHTNTSGMKSIGGSVTGLSASGFGQATIRSGISEALGNISMLVTNPDGTVDAGSSSSVLAGTNYPGTGNLLEGYYETDGWTQIGDLDYVEWTNGQTNERFRLFPEKHWR